MTVYVDFDWELLESRYPAKLLDSSQAQQAIQVADTEFQMWPPAGGPAVPPPTGARCGMIVVPGADQECGGPAPYRYRDGQHRICHACWAALDADIAAEYQYCFEPDLHLQVSSVTHPIPFDQESPQ